MPRDRKFLPHFLPHLQRLPTQQELGEGRHPRFYLAAYIAVESRDDLKCPAV
jgi:hypothetical protein